MAGDAVIVAGLGFRTSASVESLLDALEEASGTYTVDALATAEDKAQAPAFQAASAAKGLKVVGVDAQSLQAQDTVTRSFASETARGTGSVAEAAALAAAGPGARLIVRRVISNDRLATCALAEGVSR